MNEKLFTNLKIISKIKVNDKFHIDKDCFIVVEKNNILLSLLRYVYKVDRNINIGQLNEIYDDIFLFIKNQLYSKYLQNNQDLNHLEYEKHLELCYLLKRIYIELDSSKIGLNNLKKTYNYDILIDSKLDNIINRIDNNIYKIKENIIIVEEITLNAEEF